MDHVILNNHILEFSVKIFPSSRKAKIMFYLIRLILQGSISSRKRMFSKNVIHQMSILAIGRLMSRILLNGLVASSRPEYSEIRIVELHQDRETLAKQTISSSMIHNISKANMSPGN